MKYFVRTRDAGESVGVRTAQLGSTTARTGSEAAQSTGPMLGRMRRSKYAPTTLIGDFSEVEAQAVRNLGVELYEDFYFDCFTGPDSQSKSRTSGAKYWEMSSANARDLNDVMEQINAPSAWEVSRGRGVTIAVVDTGVCSTLPEIPQFKQSPIDLPTTYAGAHWKDEIGHGSMCAAIAGATVAEGGRYSGVAPGATIVAARTTLRATDIFQVYDELIDLTRSGLIDGPLVISNSFGSYSCSADVAFPDDHPFMEIVLAAVDAGIVVVFAAGNNHVDECGHDPSACSPNTIWGVNSHDRVISVGTVDENETNRDASTPHCNSSRGPGQWADEYPKPDCVAPTYGEVVWGCGYRRMDWWGTSGACPQVAGLAALLLELDRDLRPEQVADIVRSSCRDLSGPRACVGQGLIDCDAAVRLLAT